MVINAKFASVCPVCSKSIEVGAKVEWSKGQKAIHAECHTPPKKAAKVKQPDLDVAVMKNGFHIKGYGIAPTIHGDISGFIVEIHTDKEAEKFLREKGYELVKVNTVRYEWRHIETLREMVKQGKCKVKQDAKGKLHVYE